MTEKERKFLSDVVYSMSLIEDFIKDIKSFTEYSSDLKTKAAVERHLGIIGEAVNKYLKEDDNALLEHSAKIVSLRNRLVHSYDSVDDSIIWSIITRHLHPLKEEIRNKLG